MFRLRGSLLNQAPSRRLQVACSDYGTVVGRLGVCGEQSEAQESAGTTKQDSRMGQFHALACGVGLERHASQFEKHIEIALQRAACRKPTSPQWVVF